MPIHPLGKDWRQSLREDREAFILADELGYVEGLCGEHVTDRAENITSCAMFIATLASATKQIRLGTGTVNMPNAHPAAVAGQLAMLDHLLDGRFIFGISPGGLLSDAEVFGNLGADRAAMFNGLEVRAPFLHRPLAEFAASLSHVHKLRGRSGKHILKALAARYLPPSLVHRKKHGFAVPIGDLLRVRFRERVTDTLLSTTNPAAAWFNRITIETMLAAHLSGRRDYGKRLWALLILFTVAGRRAVVPPLAAYPAAVRLAASHE